MNAADGLRNQGGRDGAVVTELNRGRANGRRGEPVTDIVVQKYGGSSVATDEKVRRVAEFVASTHRAGRPTVVVVSARGDTTDELLALAGEDHRIRTARETDQLIATGEQVSAALMAMALKDLGVEAVSLTGGQAGITAVGKHGAGVIADIETSRITQELAAGRVVVIAGFQGLNEHGDLITLGRGGSDTTAVAIAAALEASSCEIYTDVDGVYTADPRVVPDAQVLPHVDAHLMAEMSFAGAKVLHSRSVELAAMQHVELHVRSSYADANGPGTVIRAGGEDTMLETDGVVSAVTHDLDVARVLVQSWGSARDLGADLLSLLSRHAIPADLVARSGPYEDEFRMGFTIRRSDVEEARAALREAVAPYDGHVRVDDNVAKISLLGIGLLNRPEYTARLLSTLSGAEIPTSWVSTSQLRTSAIVPATRALEAVQLLHREFGLDQHESGIASAVPA